MTVQQLQDENRRLRRRLRDAKDALRDAEDSIAWVVEQALVWKTRAWLARRADL